MPNTLNLQHLGRSSVSASPILGLPTTAALTVWKAAVPAIRAIDARTVFRTLYPVIPVAAF